VIPADTIDVEPDTYHAASQVFGDTVHTQVTTTTQNLENALRDSGAMAGSDPAGTSWAGTYDPAAREVHGVMVDLEGGCMKIAVLLQQTGFNHGRAESASDPTGTTPAPADTTRYDSVPGRSPAALPSASGGSGSPPTGWGLVESAVGYVWPNGHQDKLRAAARAWTTAAEGLETASADVPEAVRAISGQKSAETDDALAVCNGMVGHLQDTAAACRSLAQGCNDLADGIDKAHQDIEDELVSLVEWTAAIEAGGLVVGIFTAGIGEGAAQAAEAGRIAVTASRIGKFIQTLIDLAGTVTRAIGTVFSKIGQVAQRLKRLLGVRVTEATTEAASKTPELAKDAEAAATDDLTAAAREAHHRELGMDPATKGFRQSEAETGARVEDERGVTLSRSPEAKGPDWVGSDGKTYDSVGNFDGKYFDRQWGNLQDQIVKHLDKADYVPVDISKFTPEQIAKVKEFIGPLGPRVFTVGG
jgi:CdiA C-terminal tRNase domain